MKKIIFIFVLLAGCSSFDLEKENAALRAREAGRVNMGEPGKISIVIDKIERDQIGTPVLYVYFINRTGKKIDGLKFYVVPANNFNETVCNVLRRCRFDGIYQEGIPDNQYRYAEYNLYNFDAATKVKDKKIYTVIFEDGKTVNY